MKTTDIELCIVVYREGSSTLTLRHSDFHGCSFRRKKSQNTNFGCTQVQTIQSSGGHPHLSENSLHVPYRLWSRSDALVFVFQAPSHEEASLKQFASERDQTHTYDVINVRIARGHHYMDKTMYTKFNFMTFIALLWVQM